MDLISICIPTYEMHGKAKELLTRNFDMLKKQTYKNFEIIISDNSKDNTIQNLCEDLKYESLNIKYSRNSRIGLAPNINEAIKKASGKLIKILFMDDFFADENSLKDILDNFKGNWLVTGCGHDKGNGKIINTHFPVYNKNMHLGKNTIGSPSVLTIKNENIFFFDENLSWVLDCDYYKRLYNRYGKPDILNKVNVIIGVGKHQTTNHLDNNIKQKEYLYIEKKYTGEISYKNKLLKLLKLW